MNGATFLYSSVNDGPTEALWKAVYNGQWTEGGMAEAGWFLVGHTNKDTPIFSRTRHKVTIR